MGLAGSNTRLDERNHTLHPTNLEIPHCVGHTPMVQPFPKTSPAWVPNHWWWPMGVRKPAHPPTQDIETLYTFVAWWKRWECLILKYDRSAAQTLLCFEPRSSHAQWGARVEGVRSDVFPIIVYLPSLAPLTYVSRNKVRMQVSFSLWFLWTINTTFISSNISKYKPAILRSWSLKTFFFFN